MGLLDKRPGEKPPGRILTIARVHETVPQGGMNTRSPMTRGLFTARPPSFFLSAPNKTTAGLSPAALMSTSDVRARDRLP